MDILLHDNPPSFLGSRTKHCLFLGERQGLLLYVEKVGCLLCLPGNLRPAMEQDLWTCGFSEKPQSIPESTVQMKNHILGMWGKEAQRLVQWPIDLRGASLGEVRRNCGKGCDCLACPGTVVCLIIHSLTHPFFCEPLHPSILSLALQSALLSLERSWERPNDVPIICSWWELRDSQRLYLLADPFSRLHKPDKYSVYNSLSFIHPYSEFH